MENRHPEVVTHANTKYGKYIRKNGYTFDNDVPPDYIWENSYIDISGNAEVDADTDEDFIPISQLEEYIEYIASSEYENMMNAYNMTEEAAEIINSYIRKYVNGDIQELSVEMPLLEDVFKIYAQYDVNECAYHICGKNITEIIHE